MEGDMVSRVLGGMGKDVGFRMDEAKGRRKESALATAAQRAC